MPVNGFLVNNTVQKYNYESLENYNTPDFSTSSTYQVGDYVMYQGKLYKCTTAITTGGAWDSTKWSLAILSNDVADLKSAISSGGLTEDAKVALLACFAHTAWTDENGQDYYDALEEALYTTTWAITNNLTHCTTSNAAQSVIKGNSYSATITASVGYVMTGATVSITMGGNDITATTYNNGVISIPAVTGALVITISAAALTVSSISAVYTQSGDVCATDSLDSLKSDLVVTATFSDSSTATVPSANYTLSGTLAVGTSTITVFFGGKTTTFTVSVTWDYGWNASSGVLPTGMTAKSYDFTTEPGALFVQEPNLDFDYIGDGAIEIELKWYTEPGNQPSNNPQISLLRLEKAGTKIWGGTSDKKISTNISGTNAATAYDGSVYHTYTLEGVGSSYTLTVDGTDITGSGVTNNDYLGHTGINCAAAVVMVFAAFIKSIKFKKG